jgi:hypothetical protein
LTATPGPPRRANRRVVRAVLRRSAARRFVVCSHRTATLAGLRHGEHFAFADDDPYTSSGA